MVSAAMRQYIFDSPDHPWPQNIMVMAMVIAIAIAIACTVIVTLMNAIYILSN